MNALREELSLSDIVRIRYMRDAARRAVEIGAGKTIEELDPDSETALALTRLLDIAGEAARHVSLATQDANPHIPWRLIAAMRNRIIHKYFDVDFWIVAAVVQDDLPPLIKQLDQILTEKLE